MGLNSNFYYPITTIGIQPEVDMSFEEVDKLFYLLENPTRRRILQLLSVERLYPLKMHKQLSREIDVTQQAIVKHLKILEEHGLVESQDEPSNRGPNRRVYTASREISLHIDIGPSTYKQKAETDFDISTLSSQNKRVLVAIEESRHMDSRARMDLLSRVSEDLRKSVDEVEDERRSLMALMGELNREITSTAQGAECDYQERRLLHHILQNKDYTIESAAASLSLREPEVRVILESLQNRGLTR